MLHASKKLLLVVLAFLMWTCGKEQIPQPTYVQVSLAQLPQGTDAVVVTVTLDGVTQRKSPYTLKPPATEFWIELDSASSGQLSISVSGTDTTGCQSSSGRSDRKISGEPYIQTSIAMALNASPICPINIRIKGDGKVTADALGVECSQDCSVNVPINQTVVFRASPDRPTTQYVWSGACKGSADCTVTVTGSASVNIDFSPRVCTQGGSQSLWCWENPLIQGNPLRGVWITPDPNKTVYAVGDSGTVVSWNGVAWSILDSGTRSNFYGIWGAGGNDFWAVGKGGTAQHFKDGAWSSVSAPGNLRAVSGTGANDIWAVGEGGVILHWDGSKWSNTTSGTTEFLSSVWAIASNDAWAVGDVGVVIHWDGASWKVVSSGTSKNFSGVWASGRDDVWMVGDETALHWTGSKFIPGGDFSGSNLYAIWGAGTNNIYVSSGYGSLRRWDGTQWTIINSKANGTLFSITGSTASNIWAVGGNGSIVFYDGTSWATANQGIAGDYTNFRAGWGSSSVDAWVTGSREFGGDSEFAMHWDGLQWKAVNLPVSNKPIYAMWGSEPDNVWGVGDTIVRWNGSSWSQYPMPTSGRLVGVWGNGPNNVWAVGNATAGANSGVVIRWQGSAWETMAGTPADSFNSIYIVDEEAWVGGSNGKIWHWTGNVWQQQDLGLPYPVSSISGTGKMDIYAATQAAPFHWDGAKWATQSAPGTNSISKMLSVQPNEAWLLAGNGVFRYNGTTWTGVDTGTSNSLSGIFGLSSDLWIHGRGGTILHYRR